MDCKTWYLNGVHYSLRLEKAQLFKLLCIESPLSAITPMFYCVKRDEIGVNGVNLDTSAIRRCFVNVCLIHPVYRRCLRKHVAQYLSLSWTRYVNWKALACELLMRISAIIYSSENVMSSRIWFNWGINLYVYRNIIILISIVHTF